MKMTFKLLYLQATTMDLDQGEGLKGGKEKAVIFKLDS